ncbi:hypothetical protein NQ318_014869 [Aromia moschata]|uniref:Uncharacterized protein n=1 Tax=Aromia moschata TaxID=1265417 RepID=A0AAV8YTB5_9CUCU|nr:hypothetical protein NQ318_014869 [Aromia moschata]
MQYSCIHELQRTNEKYKTSSPCKNSPQNNCDVTTAATIYEDLHDVIPRPTPTHHHPQLAGGHIVAPSIELHSGK